MNRAVRQIEWVGTVRGIPTAQTPVMEECVEVQPSMVEPWDYTGLAPLWSTDAEGSQWPRWGYWALGEAKQVLAPRSPQRAQSSSGHRGGAGLGGNKGAQAGSRPPPHVLCDGTGTCERSGSGEAPRGQREALREVKQVAFTRPYF